MSDFLFLQSDIDKANKLEEKKKPKEKKEKKETVESDLKFRNIKYYCKKYGISVKKAGVPNKRGNWYSVGELSKKIYDYEVEHRVRGGFYPFLG